MRASGLGTMAYNSFTGIGKGGIGTLKVDGTVVEKKKMETDHSHHSAVGRKL